MSEFAVAIVVSAAAGAMVVTARPAPTVVETEVLRAHRLRTVVADHQHSGVLGLELLVPLRAARLVVRVATAVAAAAAAGVDVAIAVAAAAAIEVATAGPIAATVLATAGARTHETLGRTS